LTRYNNAFFNSFFIKSQISNLWQKTKIRALRTAQDKTKATNKAVAATWVALKATCLRTAAWALLTKTCSKTYLQVVTRVVRNLDVQARALRVASHLASTRKMRIWTLKVALSQDAATPAAAINLTSDAVATRVVLKADLSRAVAVLQAQTWIANVAKLNGIKPELYALRRVFPGGHKISGECWPDGTVFITIRR
jgi:hypothetical protein